MFRRPDAGVSQVPYLAQQFAVVDAVSPGKNLEIVPASLGPDLARLAGICVALDAESS